MAVKNKKLWLIYMIYDCNSISAVSQPVNISSHWIKPPVLLKWTQEAVGFIHCQRDEWHSVSKQRRRKSCPRRHSIRGLWAAAALFCCSRPGRLPSLLSGFTAAPPLCSAAFPEPSTFLDRAGAASLSSSASQHSNKELIDWESRAQPPPPPPAATPVARLQPQGVHAADAQWFCGPLVLRRSFNLSKCHMLD